MSALNRYPELKAFLVQGEAEYYEGISVTFIKGKKAVLTLYNGEEEVEQIDLQQLNDKDKLHALLQEKGFKLREDLPKSLEELRAENEGAFAKDLKERLEARARRAEEREERKRRAQEEVQQRKAEAVEASTNQATTITKPEGVASEL